MAAIAPPYGSKLLGSSWLRLGGPAFAVSIGYIDPGNWASDIAAGAFGFRLLWVILASNVLAITLQLAVAKITLATREDLATSIARRWPRWRTPAWLLFTGAIMATDVAEFTGIVLGVQLLFGLDRHVSTLLGVAVVAALLVASRRRMRTLDIAVLAALAAISVAMFRLTIMAAPNAGAILHGALVPALPGGGAILVAVAIIGATVMPHNLFLHSALINERMQDRRASEAGSGRFFALETIVALNIAAAINGAILVVGASVHGAQATIDGAFAALRSGMGGSTVFGLALIISGIAASTTATVSGDAISGALAPIRMSSTTRRTLAVLPAAALLMGNIDATALLLWSQTILCIVLPAAIVPLVLLLRRENRPFWRQPLFFHLTTAAAAICASVNLVLLRLSIIN